MFLKPLLPSRVIHFVKSSEVKSCTTWCL